MRVLSTLHIILALLFWTSLGVSFVHAGAADGFEGSKAAAHCVDEVMRIDLLRSMIRGEQPKDWHIIKNSVVGPESTKRLREQALVAFRDFDPEALPIADRIAAHSKDFDAYTLGVLYFSFDKYLESPTLLANDDLFQRVLQTRNALKEKLLARAEGHDGPISSADQGYLQTYQIVEQLKPRVLPDGSLTYVDPVLLRAQYQPSRLQFEMKELDPDHSGNGDIPFSEERLARSQVYAYNHRLYDASGQLMNSPRGKEPRLIFVMGRNGNIYAAHGQSGVTHHSSFFRGKAVAGAGEVFIRDGRIEEINNGSGHYHPPARFLKQVLLRLEEMGIEVEKVSHLDR